MFEKAKEHIGVYGIAVMTLLAMSSHAIAGQGDPHKITDSYSMSDMLQDNIKRVSSDMLNAAIRACVGDLNNPNYDNMSMIAQYHKTVNLGAPSNFYMQLSATIKMRKQQVRLDNVKVKYACESNKGVAYDLSSSENPASNIAGRLMQRYALSVAMQKRRIMTRLKPTQRQIRVVFNVDFPKSKTDINKGFRPQTNIISVIDHIKNIKSLKTVSGKSLKTGLVGAQMTCQTGRRYTDLEGHFKPERRSDTPWSIDLSDIHSLPYDKKAGIIQTFQKPDKACLAVIKAGLDPYNGN